MADRIGVINRGEIILAEGKAELMRKLGRKQLTLQLHAKLDALPTGTRALQSRAVRPSASRSPTYSYDTQGERTGITALLDDLHRAGVAFRDLRTTESSLEEIFVGLVRQDNNGLTAAVRAIYVFEMSRTEPHVAAEHQSRR